MSFEMPLYRSPDFCSGILKDAPDVKLVPAKMDGVAPEGYHSTSMYPEDRRQLEASGAQQDGLQCGAFR